MLRSLTFTVACVAATATPLVDVRGRRTFSDAMKEGILQPNTTTTIFSYANVDGGVLTYLCPSTFCRTPFQIERTALHSYGSDPHSC